jgi:hypothetical protein
MSIYDDSSELVSSIRAKTDELKRVADEFVVLLEEKIKQREIELDKHIAKYQLLGKRKIELDDIEKGLIEREKLLQKEKIALREKQQHLTKQEDEVKKKLLKVQNLLQ